MEAQPIFYDDGASDYGSDFTAEELAIVNELLAKASSPVVAAIPAANLVVGAPPNLGLRGNRYVKRGSGGPDATNEVEKGLSTLEEGICSDPSATTGSGKSLYPDDFP